MTGNELMRILSSIPDNRMNFPVIFVDTSNPDISYGIDKVVDDDSGFVTLMSVENIFRDSSTKEV
jgi:hypothetical protein